MMWRLALGFSQFKMLEEKLKELDTKAKSYTVEPQTNARDKRLYVLYLRFSQCSFVRMMLLLNECHCFNILYYNHFKSLLKLISLLHLEHTQGTQASLTPSLHLCAHSYTM